MPKAAIAPAFIATDRAQILNEQCACITLDRVKLNAELARELDASFQAHANANVLTVGAVQDKSSLRDQNALLCGLALSNDATIGLFSDTTLFVSAKNVRQIDAFIAAHQRITALTGWRSAALNGATEVTRHETGSQGVLMGYDFHLSEQGPQLIEINTNAGGALLNMTLARAQRACCGLTDPMQTQAQDSAKMLDMFYAEWRACKANAPLRHVAIVDQSPLEQYLLPEFLLFQALFERAGIRASICDPSELVIVDGTLQLQGVVVDMIYNRCTDFAFASASSANLRLAWLADLAVITPNPYVHAVFADKRLLVRLSDPDFLASIGAIPNDIALCSAQVPPTRLVQAEDALALWQDRNMWFFKPADGFGGKATYRGDKLTRRVFDEILLGSYVAQRIVAPSLRVQNVGGKHVLLKTDLRAYSYAGEVLLYAARLYQGQTTNFRTPGGGFASVVEIASA